MSKVNKYTESKKKNDNSIQKGKLIQNYCLVDNRNNTLANSALIDCMSRKTVQFVIDLDKNGAVEKVKSFCENHNIKFDEDKYKEVIDDITQRWSSDVAINYYLENRILAFDESQICDFIKEIYKNAGFSDYYLCSDILKMQTDLNLRENFTSYVKSLMRVKLEAEDVKKLLIPYLFPRAIDKNMAQSFVNTALIVEKITKDEFSSKKYNELIIDVCLRLWDNKDSIIEYCKSEIKRLIPDKTPEITLQYSDMVTSVSKDTILKLPASAVRLLIENYSVSEATIREAMNTIAASQGGNGIRITKIRPRGIEYEAELKLQEMGDDRIFGKRDGEFIVFEDKTRKGVHS